MQILQRLAKSTHLRPVLRLNLVPRPTKTINSKLLSTKSTRGGGGDDDEWNDAWETAWLPDDLVGKEASPWESDVNFGLSSSGRDDGRPTPNMVPSQPAELDAETKAFVEEMNENWAERKKGSSAVSTNNELERVEGAEKSRGEGGGLYSLDNVRKDYRLKKQRVHAGLWVKEIEKLEEARLGGNGGGGDDIEKLLDSCSDIFDSPSGDFGHSEVPRSSSSEIRNRPDGWESTAREQDGSIWDMTQREEDILLQEFDRRMAFCKFQIASFIKTHIFSRRRPIDGWKYMIEEIGPNARRGKGSVSRLPSLSDPATQPFKEEIQAADSGHFPSLKGR